MNTFLLAFATGLALGAMPPARGFAVLLALLPIASLAAWTGSIFIEECDLIILGAALVWLIRGRTRASFIPHVWWALWLISALIAADRGLGAMADLAPPTTYHTGWNALRLLKPTLLATLLVGALARQALRLDTLQTALMQGLAGGLALTSLVCLWERVAFPGWTNFSADYRITGPFWEMHMGGAALDGYLALSLPAAVWCLLRANTALRALGAALLFGLASYVALTTFSRALHGALVVMVLIWAGAWWRAQAPRVSLIARGGVMGLMLVAGALMVWVFDSGGYRALAAVCAVMAIFAWLAAQPWPPGVWAACARVGAGAAGVVVLGGWLPKAAYLAFALALAAFIWAAWRAGAALQWACALVVAASAVWVAGYWGGPAAAVSALVACLAALAIAHVCALRARAGRAVFQVSQKGAAGFASGLVFAAWVAVLSHSAFMGERLSGLAADAQGRLAHWQAGLAIWSEGSVAARLLGAGLGRYPQQTGAHEGERPGTLTHAFMDEGGVAFLRLTGPSRHRRVADVLRVSQQQPRWPAEPVVLSLQARAPAAARLQVDLCYKHLLYAESCEHMSIAVPPGDTFAPAVRTVDLSRLKPGPPWAPRDAMIALSVSGGQVDVTELSVQGASGGDLIDNGDFREGRWRWFFTSDHDHLPWHAKNLLLHVLIEQGVLGVMALMCLCLYTALQAARAMRPDNPQALLRLAALAGFAVVGLTDSLLDAPRVALVAALVLLAPWAPESPAARI